MSSFTILSKEPKWYYTFGSSIVMAKNAFPPPPLHTMQSVINNKEEEAAVVCGGDLRVPHNEVRIRVYTTRKWLIFQMGLSSTVGCPME